MPVNDLAGYGQFTRTDEQLDKEILYSANDYIKKGGVIAQSATAGPGADGVLPAGTILGVITASGKWGPYINADVTTGVGTAVAVLARATDVSKSDQHANIYFSGWFKTAQLVGLDAAGVTDLDAKQNTQYGWTHVE